ncbi:hypothetical protein PMAN_a2543 [Pseudoalteromonas marina]|uniref:GIY-YIG nuclease family protein n=1 Tax=Pseudoalteromonas marina TaxID=267375 RepID=UPI00026CFCF0|nr:GIY-YIG nuclease family protein [Pseudoalteromonas marina]KAF7777291.1 hypothetical protein PMAN_a2543 [Pseudoalteromonas marina]
MAKQGIEVDGIAYSSISEASEQYHLNPKLIVGRLRSGWSIEEAFELAPRRKLEPNRRQSISVKVNGKLKSYSTIKDAADEYGIEPKLVRARLTNFNWTPEEALGIIERDSKRIAHNRKEVKFSINGVDYHFLSVTEAAKSQGLNEFLVFNRLNSRGWSIEQALELATPPAHTKKCYGYIYLIKNNINSKYYVGQTMSPVTERWKSHVGLASKGKTKSKHSLSAAILRYGADAFDITIIDHADSINELNKLERYWIKKLKTKYPDGYNLNRGGSGFSKGRSVVLENLTFPSVSEAARAYGFKYRLVADRLRYGWTLEQAFELAPAPETHKFAGRKFTIKDSGNMLTFNSVGELASSYNLPTARVLQRLVKLNWTPEQAVGLVEPPKWVHPMHSFQLEINGKTRRFKSKAEAAAFYGFDRWETIRKRLSRGWTLEQSLGLETPPINKHATKLIDVEINGNKVKYSSMSKAAEANGVCFKRVSARLKLGWSYEEALEIRPRSKS